MNNFTVNKCNFNNSLHYDLCNTPNYLKENICNSYSPPPCHCYPINSSSIDTKITFICNNFYNYFLNKPHVVGLGLGYKTIKNCMTSEKALLIYVDKKLPLNQLPDSGAIDSLFKGIPTDVVESGKFHFNHSLKDKIRPSLGGCSIGTPLCKSVGTLCCLVSRGNDVFILGNNHVMAGFNTAPLCTPIIQPSIVDGGTIPSNIIAYLSDYVPLNKSTPNMRNLNEVDCALGRLTNLSLVSPNIAMINRPPQGIITPKLNTMIKKIGRTTAMTMGMIASINATIEADGYIFVNQFIGSLTSCPGDSGAIVLSENDMAIGMLNTGSNKGFSSINPMACILSSLKVALVKN